MATAPLGLDRPATITDFSDATLYTDDVWREPFAKQRASAPLSYLPDSPYGPYWSAVTLDLIQQIELQPKIFSSSYEHGGITITEGLVGEEFPNFIAMDEPQHTAQRKVVQPSFKPSEMARRETEIRIRTAQLFDSLPVGETFDWVDKVSIELTIGMMAIIFDFPWEQRRDLKRWSDIASDVQPGQDEARRERFYAEMFAMLNAFDSLLEAKRALPPTDDLMSRMIHSDAMGNMPQMERLANIALLIVGGNDTTRNSMSGFIDAINQYPDQFALLREKPELIPNAAQEIIRWQSPVTHMRRTCLQDVEIGGQHLAKGDKVILWYISGNRDESVFTDADRFDVTRENARRHIAFGHGIHRCVGARLAEIQLAVLFEEIIRRNVRIEMQETPTRLSSCFLHGFTAMSVKMVPMG